MRADSRLTPTGRKAVYDAAQLRRAYGERTWEHYRPLLAELVEFAPPGRVLDVGAGMGLFVECCRAFGLRCIGLEGSVETAAFTRHRGFPSVAARLELALPFADRSFQAVFCNQVIEHLEPQVVSLLFSESLRVLAPGGVLLVHSPSPRDREQRREPEHINMYLPSRLRRELAEAGFEILAERNGPIQPLGNGRLRTAILKAILQFGSADIFSATANAVGRRPQ